jgi:aminoglycoside 6'-N-acetyltransferase
MPERDALDPALLDFRPLAKADLSLLCEWLNAPHARPWFGNGRSLTSVAEEYVPYIEGTVPIRALLVSYAERPIGMISWERFGDWPDFMRVYGVDDPDSVNCDVVIGEADIAHRGLGAPMLRRFLREIVFSDPRFTACIIDPRPENAIAIRAYEKAGFRHVRTVADDGEGEAVYLMELRRDDLSGSSK